MHILAVAFSTEHRVWVRVLALSGWNTESIGVEHIARTPGEFRNWANLDERTRAALLADGDVTAETDPGMAVTQAQLARSAHLVAWLCKQRGWAIGRERIRGHCENPASSHRDCGRDVADGGIWPWSDYMDMVIQEMANV